MSWKEFLLIIITVLFSSIFDSLLAVQLLNASSGIYAGRTVNFNNIIVHQYLGIEYAQVRKRFDRAEPIRRQNETVLNATEFGPVCKPAAGSCSGSPIGFPTTPYCSVNYGIFSVRSIPAEQCLFLNVFIPVTPYDRQKKAIFLWIHGGSGQIGTGNVFDGTIFAALGDVIVVTFNFRLNLFGFLSSGDDRLEGNLGLYDQALVLDWIYENSDALGGDIRRITVGGHSAGAPHAYYLAASPFNQQRIRRLLLQSGSPFNIWSHLKAQDAMEKFNLVANDNSCGNLTTFEEKLKCLEERDLDSIAEYEHHSYTSANHTNVVTSGNYMSQFREEFQENDALADVDILIGSTDDEGVYVAIVPIIMQQMNQEVITLHNVNFTDVTLKFLAAMQPNRTCLHQKALELYHLDKISSSCSSSFDCYCSVFYNYSRLITDILFHNDYYRFLDQRLKYSNRTYIYQYSHRTAQEHPTPCNDYLQKRDLVGHFAELEYTWGTPLYSENANVPSLIKYIRYEFNASIETDLIHNYTAEEIQFSRQLIEQWSNFIKYGRPISSKFGNDWPPISNLSTAMIMQLQVNESEIRRLEVPAGVLFWKQECPQMVAQKSSQGRILAVSLTVYFCSFVLLNKVLRLISFI